MRCRACPCDLTAPDALLWFCAAQVFVPVQDGQAQEEGANEHEQESQSDGKSQATMLSYVIICGPTSLHYVKAAQSHVITVTHHVGSYPAINLSRRTCAARQLMSRRRPAQSVISSSCLQGERLSKYNGNTPPARYLRTHDTVPSA